MSKSNPIPLCEPSLSGREREYVDEVIQSGWVSSAGPFVNRFEEAFAAKLGTPEAVAVASGTAALHLSLLAVGVQPEDEVLVSSMTFIAPANAIRYAGAWPVFVDADASTWEMDLGQVREFLANDCRKTADGLINSQTGRRVSAVVPVHILGHPVDMDALLEIATEYDLKVVEDATESLGGYCRGRAAGTIGQVGCFSFNGNKLITSGGGGMIVSNDERILKTVRHLSTQAKEPGNEYIHDRIGFNYRLTNLQAALGYAQFEQVDEFLAKKRAIAETYRRAFAKIDGIEVQAEAEWAKSAWWLFTIVTGLKHFTRDSRDLIAALAAERITSRPLWQPMHRSAPHAGSFALSCPVADRLFEGGVSLPSSVSLSAEDQERVIGVICSWAAANSPASSFA